MPNLLNVGPGPLSVVLISIAMITIIVRTLGELKQWTRPVLSGVPYLQDNKVIEQVTYLRCAYFSMALYGITHVLALILLLGNGQPAWLDNFIIWILLINALVILLWIMHHALFAKEPPRQPLQLPVDE
jgi:hypothetical protein